MQNVTDVTCQVESSSAMCETERRPDCTLVTRLKTRVEAGAERDRSPDPMCELHSLSLFDFEVLIHCASKNTRSARAPDTAVFRYPLPVMFIVGAPSMCALPTAALSLACPPHQKAYLNLKLWAHRQRALSQRHIYNVQRALWLLATRRLSRFKPAWRSLPRSPRCRHPILGIR